MTEAVYTGGVWLARGCVAPPVKGCTVFEVSKYCKLTGELLDMAFGELLPYCMIKTWVGNVEVCRIF